MPMRSRMLGIGILLGMMACTQPPEPATGDAPGAAAATAAEEPAGFINRVWAVAERSDGSEPGSLYVFLSDGTLVIASPNATPSFGAWRAQGDGLVMVEEGIEYNVDILAITSDEFRIRSHNPGGTLDIRFVPASDRATNTGETTASFRAPPALGGRLERSDDGFRFFACDNQGEGRMVEVAPDASALFAEISTDGALTVVVRMVGERITDIRYAGPSEVNCNRFPPDAIVEAWGNEPFWNLAVQREVTLFRTPEQLAGVRYTDGVWTGAGNGQWVYNGSLAPPTAGAADSQSDAAGARVRLELSETECRDGMSGARFPFRAVLIRASERFEGCALEGRQAMR